MARRLARDAAPDDFDDYADDEFVDEDSDDDNEYYETRKGRVLTRSKATGEESWDDDDAPEEEPARRVARKQPTRRNAAEERPSRRSVSREEPEEEERPRRGFRKASESDEKPSRSRRVRSSEDEPKKPSRGRTAPARDILGHGFSSYKAEAAKRSVGYKSLDVPEGGRKRKLIKFLEAEPVAHFYEHWVPTENGKKRPYVCLGDVCALCGIGDRSKPVLMYNVVDMDDGLVKVWKMSKDPAKRVEERFDEALEAKKDLADFNTYYAVSKKKGENNFTAYKVDVIKRRDVEEDFELEPLGESELEELLEEVYDDSIVYIPSVADLQKVAEDIRD